MVGGSRFIFVPSLLERIKVFYLWQLWAWNSALDLSWKDWGQDCSSNSTPSAQGIDQKAGREQSAGRSCLVNISVHRFSVALFTLGFGHTVWLFFFSRTLKKKKKKAIKTGYQVTSRECMDGMVEIGWWCFCHPNCGGFEIGALFFLCPHLQPWWVVFINLMLLKANTETKKQSSRPAGQLRPWLGRLHKNQWDASPCPGTIHAGHALGCEDISAYFHKH